MKIYTLILCVLVSISGQGALSDERNLLHQVESLMTEIGSAGTFSSSQQFGQLTDFEVSPSNAVAGATSDYRFTFGLLPEYVIALDSGSVLLSIQGEFGLANVSAGSFSANTAIVDYEIGLVEYTGNYVVVILDQIAKNIPDSLGTEPIDITIELTDIVNPTAAGEYRVTGFVFNSSPTLLAGPTESAAFSIVAGAVESLLIQPVGDLNIRAGESLEFEAEGFDMYGNMISPLIAEWRLQAGSDSIGTVSGGRLEVSRVGQGRVEVTSGGVVTRSGIITVLPGTLASMVLEIYPEQIVGQPFIPDASITLRDGYENLKTDYDIEAKPIALIINDGRLLPDTLSNADLLTDGQIDLSALPLRYEGPTTVTHLYATTNGYVNTAPVTLSLNGYDILDILDARGQTLQSIYSGVETLVDVILTNGGRLMPEVSPELTFSLNPVIPLASSSTPGLADGRVDTISLFLPPIDSDTTDTTLTAVAEALFLTNDSLRTYVDTLKVPVAVLAPRRVRAVPHSLTPDTIYPGQPFDLSVKLAAADVTYAPTAPKLRINLMLPGGNMGPSLVNEFVEPLSIFEDTIAYSGIEGRLAATGGASSGRLSLYMNYLHETSEAIYVLSDQLADSIYVLPEIQVRYIDNSFGPLSVYAGNEASFGFNIELDGEYSVPVILEDAVVRVLGANYSLATNLRFVDPRLNPGVNLVETEKLFIPEDQLGESLALSAQLSYAIPGTRNVLTFTTDFDNTPVQVTEQPVAQITGLEILAPNVPNVNTSQSFQARCLLANLSGSPLGPLFLQLSSDGNSSFDSLTTVPSVPPFDTIEVIFDITADTFPINQEVFKVDIASPHIVDKPPVDNVAVVRIERPAELELSFDLFGADDGIVDHNGAFSAAVALHNVGQADASEVPYRLTTGGVDFGLDDTVSGVIHVNDPIPFFFVAPEFDTSVVFKFELLEHPIDLNSGEPAVLNDSTISFSIEVELLATELEVAVSTTGSNLVVPGRQKELFEISFTNQGAASVSTVYLNRLELSFLRDDNTPLDVGGLLDLEQTSFVEGGQAVSTTWRGGDILIAYFQDFVIPPQETRTIQFLTALLGDSFTPVTVHMETDDIEARFLEGPYVGDTVTVMSQSGSRLLLSQMYVTKGQSLKESFLIRNNPFDPHSAPAEFTYELQEPSAVEFRVFTLTGEKVHARFLEVGQPGTSVGEQTLTWDGRNDEGHIVHNGIFVVILNVIKTGAEARLKVAVVK